MSVAHQIAGYDKRTELLTINLALPIGREPEARALVGMGRDDDGLGSYPIDESAAIVMGTWLDRPLPVDLYDWFLEPA